MFVAVVANQDPTQSGRPDGSLSCFIGADRTETIEKAILAVNRWHNQIHTHDHDFAKAGSPYGPYHILVGELTSEAKYVNFTEVKL